MASERKISAEEASINVASVEVKTLVLGRKQMTLSVFRQLPSDDVIDPDSLDLAGTPWGRVNYFWAGCGSDAEHLHIVWQRDKELFRSCVSPDARNWAGWQRRRSDFFEASYQYVLERLADDFDDGYEFAREQFAHPGYGWAVSTVRVGRLRWDVEAAGEVAQLRETLLGYYGSGNGARQAWAGMVSGLRAAGKLKGLTESVDKLHSSAAEIGHFEDLLQQRYTQLLRLDQLFIAV